MDHQDSGEREHSNNAANPQTFMASHVEVSNGFVKNGTSLPYVIETNKSGKDESHFLSAAFLTPVIQATKNVPPKFYPSVEYAEKNSSALPP